ncbi:MAG: SUMF1/EgtB/PvdO family nonheme iron enzyme, partial [Candidatus Rokubacteria bacterium]|nr:SUMF1/EgtB/PvdO family nonheme iron enzyme [Candidatus Rokubacteria bacterium]
MSVPRILVLLGVALAVGASASVAQQRDIVGTQKSSPAAPAFYTDSWAVIIGINDYQHRRVPKLRYAVTLRSGEEEGYLLPADGDPGQLFSTAISMTAIRQISDRLPAKHILYVVDACYSGYALFNRAIADDLLEEMVKKPAIQILTAGRQGDQAQERGGHGVFTEVLLRGLQGDAFAGKEWVALEELGLWTKQRVFAESNKKQLPQYGNLSGEGQFIFLKPGAQVAAVQPPSEPPKPTIREEVRQELGSLAISAKLPGVEVWLGDQKIGETKAWRALVVDNLPVGTYRVKARKAGYREWQREVQVAANARVEMAIDIEPLRTEPPKVITGEDGAEMVLVPAGEFGMGSDASDTLADADEKPRHKVFLDTFYIDKYEVTNVLYKRFIEATGRAAPKYWKKSDLNGPSQPVVGVRWRD